jgi:dolichyl-phosphate beta-glucosyltransferase
MSEINLSIIIPAYNEEKRLPKTLLEISSYLTNKKFNEYELLVVIEKSTDNTVGVVRELRNKIPKLRIIEHSKNLGKGYNVKTGMLAAHGKIRLFMDADNAIDISHLESMRGFFDQGYDLVICSRSWRDVKGAIWKTNKPLYKRFLGEMGNLLIHLLAVHNIWDTQCGFKAFCDYAAIKIFSKTKIFGFGFDIEVLAMARLYKYRIGIVPANVINDPSSSVNLLAYFKVLYELFIVLLNLRKGVYI